ncbi:hypothetical protein [Wolbachia endosymbiont (group E) of Neria commutata]|uniref:WD1261 family protein n=1 Tax=Wolbachia endosymbiont (group E) of Neria commutata TaxID=3066149 RepID=UPI003132DC4D
MVKEVEELIKIIGEGNLLEASFVFLGAFQHFNLEWNGGVERNFNGLSAFIEKEEEQLDECFNLMFSLQGLFLIYGQAYNALEKDNHLSTQGVINEIYNYHDLIKCEIINQGQLKEDQKKLKFLNLLANPKRQLIFKTEEDFENKVLTDIKKLLNEENANTTLNKCDREFVLNKCVIDYYYSIHQGVKVDKDVVLAFSICGNYYKLSEYNKELIKKEKVPIIGNVKILTYTLNLVGLLQSINPRDRNENRHKPAKYILNYEFLQGKKRSFNQQKGEILSPKNIESTMKKLLKNQNSDEFEKRVTNPKNIYCSDPQQENGYVQNFSIKKEEKNTKNKNAVCWVILGDLYYLLRFVLLIIFLWNKNYLSQ